MDNDSILTSVKNMLGATADYDAYDMDIMIHINSAFGRLCELGVGPASPFSIESAEDQWSDFPTTEQMPQIKRFVFLYVKRIFDPSANSVIMQAYKEELDKLEWLLCSVAEVGY